MTPSLNREASLSPEFAMVTESYLESASIQGLAQQGLRADRRALAVVQYDSSPDLIIKSLAKGDPAIGRESAWLRRSDQLADLRPKLLDVLEWGDRALIVMAAAPQTDRPTDRAILRVAHRLADADTTHGDFTPWNVKSNAGRIVVIDWEEARSTYIEGFDVAHYTVQRALLIERRSPTSAIKRILDPNSLLARFLADRNAGTNPVDALTHYLIVTGQDARSAERRSQRLQMLGLLSGANNPAQ